MQRWSAWGSGRSHIETGLECTSSRTSRRPLHFVDLHRPRSLLPSSPLAVASLRAIRSANCGCVRPALCASTFRDRSNRGGGRPYRAQSSCWYLSCSLCAKSTHRLSSGDSETECYGAAFCIVLRITYNIDTWHGSIHSAALNHARMKDGN